LKEIVNVLLAHSSPWWNAASYYAVTLGIALQNNDVNVVYCTSENSPEAGRAQKAGLETHFIEFNSSNPVSFLRYRKKLTEIVNKKRIDIIDCLSPQSHFFSIFPKKINKGSIPLIRSVCDAIPPKKNSINRRIYAGMADYVIFTCKRNLVKFKDRLNLTFENSTVIYAGIDEEFMLNNGAGKDFKKEFSLPEDSLIVGHLGRWSPEKGIDLFLEICSGIKKVMKNVYFLMAGKEEQISKHDIMKWGEEFNISDRLILIDWLEDVRGFIRCLDLGLITSRSSEVISRAALEFMASGKPLVVTDVNVLPEIVENDVNGFVCEKTNKDDFIRKCLTLLKDRNLRIEMGKKSRRLIESKYSLDTFAMQHIVIYNRLVNN